MAANPHDEMDLKVAQRRGRMRGCYVYISAEVLRQSGLPVGGEQLLYRAVAWGKRRVIIALETAAPSKEPAPAETPSCLT